MRDLISRSALIEAFEKPKQCMDYGNALCSKSEIESIIENAPTVEAKLVEWISMYDAFADTPYHNQSVLIKCDDGFVCSARFLLSDKGNHCGFYHKHVGFLQCPQVVAWMPYNADMRKKV